tara:strand:- start:2767 stop:3618 length:852 start_codon:yes stop_codon:yes gene_type:complete
MSLCGSTPLIKISDRVYGKLETYNPTGSVKDRMISYVIKKALDRGDITGETILCDATSGNTGIALSSVAASLGLDCVIFMPENMSVERKQMMSVYGAKIVDAPANDFSRAIAMRDEFLRSNPLSWSPCQFSNPDNVECHLKVTGPEIYNDVKSTGLAWDTFIHGSGTGGTIEGIRRYTIESSPKTRLLMVQPAESPHGIQGIADGKEFLAKDADMDGIIKIKTAEAIERARAFAEETGILVGISAGANIVASERWERHTPSDTGAIVTMLCDRGERYMSVFKS